MNYTILILGVNGGGVTFHEITLSATTYEEALDVAKRIRSDLASYQDNWAVTTSVIKKLT